MSWFLLCPALAAAEPVVSSYYSGPAFENHRMACGKIFHASDVTVIASKTLPCGQLVRLTYPVTGRSRMGIVQDRGPYVRGRDVDVSESLAKALGFKRAGVATLEAEYISTRSIS